VAWALAGVALACLAAGIAARLVGKRDTLAAAEDALRRHDPAAARAHLDRYLARWPDDGPAQLLAARAARRADAYADAERLLAAFERHWGPTEASRLEWVLLGVQQGDFGSEEERLGSAVDSNHPATLDILEALAKGYAAAVRLPEAFATLDRLLGLAPNHYAAYLVRGGLWNLRRRWEEAEADYSHAADLAPDRPAAHTALAGVLTEQGRPREAIYQYELVLRSRPGDAAALLGLARAYGDAADLAKAEQRLDELLAADPDNADGLVERGRLALRHGRPAEAEPYLARAVGLAPWHRDGNPLYLAALRELGRAEAVAREEARLAELKADDAVGGRLKNQVREKPGDVDVRWKLWQWSVRNGQRGVGFAWLVEVLRRAPWHAQAQAALADYFEQIGQPARAAMHRAAAGGRFSG
jgi:tetratricopeptide (TPR) repeat protein